MRQNLSGKTSGEKPGVGNRSEYRRVLMKKICLPGIESGFESLSSSTRSNGHFPLHVTPYSSRKPDRRQMPCVLNVASQSVFLHCTQVRVLYLMVHLWDVP